MLRDLTSSTSSRAVTRRRLMRAAAATAGILALPLLAACGGQTAAPAAATQAPAAPAAPAPTTAPAPTAAPAVAPTTAPAPAAQPTQAAPTGPRIVRFLADSWAVNEVPIDRQASLFNEKYRDKVEVRIEIKGEGWDTKLLSQIKAGTLQWSGAMVMTSPTGLAQSVLSGQIQPMESYLGSSREDGASQVLSDMIPTVKANSMYEGHLYGVPYSYENISFVWRADYFNNVGRTDAPATWDDLFDVATKIKKDAKTADVTPFAFVQDLDGSLATLMNGATDNPYTQDGIYDLTSDAATQGLLFMRKLVENDLVPPHTWDNAWPLYQKGKLASWQVQSSRGVWGEKIFGLKTVNTSPTPLRTKGGPSNGSYFWNNNMTILNKAPYPQETADFIVFAFGPQNKAMQDATITSGKTPIYESVYKNMLEGDPNYEDYKWMIPMRQQVEANKPIPATLLWSLQKNSFVKNAVKFLEKGSKVTPQELAATVMKETRDQGAKLKADLGAK